VVLKNIDNDDAAFDAPSANSTTFVADAYDVGYDQNSIEKSVVPGEPLSVAVTASAAVIAEILPPTEETP
jgi:hypothetical protein